MQCVTSAYAPNGTGATVLAGQSGSAMRHVTERSVPVLALAPAVTGGVDMRFSGRNIGRSSARFEVMAKRLSDDFGHGDAVCFGAACEPFLEFGVQPD